MKLSINHSTDTKNFRLARALLVYEDGARATATLHDVSDGETPQILPGAPVATGDFLEIASRLQGNAGARRKIIEAPLLVVDNDLLCWYRPSHRGLMFWNTKNTKLDALDGQEAQHPALLFLAKRGELYVYALGEDARPGAQTPIFRAPYFNIYPNGHLCEGNFKLPDTLRPDTIPAWEHAFFDTSFTHTNMNVKDVTKHSGGLESLWHWMTRPETSNFPAATLVSLTQRADKKPLTLEALLDR